MLAEDPFAVGPKVGLRRLALDLVAECVLTLVGVRKIELVRQEEHAGDQHGGHQNRNNDAVKADAGSLDGNDFVRALQQAERNQHRQQHAERRGGVKKEGRDVEQIFAHGERRHLIPHDVAQQLEQGEHQQQHQESGNDHGKVEHKAAQHIIVEDGWETKIEQAPAPGQAVVDAFAKGRAGRLTVQCQICHRQAGRRRWHARSLKPQTLEPGAEPSQFDRAAFRLPEQKNSSHQKHEVGKPNPGRGRQASLARKRHADHRNRIVKKDQQNGQDKSARLAAFLRREAQRNADQGQDNAGARQRQAVMEFDQVPAPGDRVGGSCDTEEFANLEFMQ